MDRGAWWAIVRGDTGSDSTEGLSLPAYIYSFSDSFPLKVITEY